MRSFLRSVRHSIFSRILIVYLLLTTIIFVVFGLSLRGYFVDILRAQELRNLEKCAIEMQSELDRCVSKAKMLVFNYYVAASKDGTYYTYANGPNVYDEFGSHILFNNYWMLRLNADADIVAIQFYRSSDGALDIYSNVAKIRNSAYRAKLDLEEDRGNWIDEKRYATAWSRYGIRLVLPLNYKLPANPIGFISITISDDRLAALAAQYSENIDLGLYILSHTGNTIYDSSGTSQGKPLEWLDDLAHLDSDSIARTGNESICYLIKRTNNYTFACRFSMATIEGKMGFVKKQLLFVLTISVTITLLLVYYVTRIYTRRANKLLAAVNKLHEDENELLDINIRGKDELSMLARSLQQSYEERRLAMLNAHHYELASKTTAFKLLQAQINPHFLFNTLGAIRAKALQGDGETTAEMIFLMSQLMRQVLKKDEIVTLNEEMEYVIMYLDLYKYRFEDHFEYDMNIPRETYSIAILRHVIQPIVENSILHGFDNTDRLHTLSIHVWIAEDYLIIEISDNGVGMSAEDVSNLNEKLAEPYYVHSNDSSGIGLVNINERIRIVYGADCGIYINCEPECTTVTVRLLSLSVEEAKKRVQNVNCR